MRPHVRAFLERCAQRLTCPEPVVEIGSRLPEGQEALADLRGLFAGKRFIGCDMQSGPGVDRIEDIHDLSFADGEVGTFVLADTLEHVRDPIHAFGEVRRALADGGIAIFTSVMHFPIHAYPSDYWRFTPEAFRELAAGFPSIAIFYCGERNFPHTVAGVAVNASAAEALRGLSEDVAGLETDAPLHVEGRAARQVRHLAVELLRAKKLSSGPRRAGDGGGFARPFNAPGWTLVSGQWIEGWVATGPAHEVEVRCGGEVVHRGGLTPMARVDADRLAVDPRADTLHFRGQAAVTVADDRYGPLELIVVDGGGGERPAGVSAPGIVLGSMPRKPGFVLHSLDVHPQAPSLGHDRMRNGRDLVASLRADGEEIVVNLGCGFRKKGNIGIDVTREGTDADIVCRLGFEPIPLDDESADKVICRDFLEHIPKAVYSERRGAMRYPVIDLMNEVWRILKPGGIFESYTPCYPHPEIHQDPTHLSVWTLESMQYFCGKYPIAKVYGVKAEFELVESSEQGFYLFARLRKPEQGSQ
ncbi:MAG: methyltransferase domain-containing protein [Planctomycetota bacterium]|jgi:SAM-dependent methyltransferase